MSNSTQADEIIRLTAKIADHEKRIASLESSLLSLADRTTGSEYPGFTQADLLSNSYFGDDDDEPVKPVPITLKRGRRPRISPEEFARRRDLMVVFIEIRWPLLVDAFNQQKSRKSILRALEIATPGAQDSCEYHNLTGHIDQLWEFLHTSRYRG